jgi:hypothetical protein
MGFCLRVGLLTPVWGGKDRWVDWPPDWVGWSGSPVSLCGHTSGCVWCRKRSVTVSRTMTGGLQMRFLDGANTWSLLVPDTNPLRGPLSWFVDGGYSRNLSLSHHIDDEEVLIGRRFWVGCGFFSWGSRGGEEETPGQSTAESFS